MQEKCKRITIITGHYGSGKTNLSINLALDMKKAGKDVVLADLDIVNPYFRTSDFTQLTDRYGVELVTPLYAGSNLDVPALTARLDGVLGSDKSIIIDVGGDDAGAFALGRYSARLTACEYTMLYVINQFRYLTREPAEALELMREIERASRLQVSAIVNNSNLGKLTDCEDILSSIPYAEQVAALANKPMLGTVCDKRLKPQTARAVYPAEIYVKKPWEV